MANKKTSGPGRDAVAHAMSAVAVKGVLTRQAAQDAVGEHTSDYYYLYWREVRQRLAKAGVSEVMLREVDTAREQLLVAEPIAQQFRNGTGYCIVLRGVSITVSHTGMVSNYTSEAALPDPLRGCLAALKLLPDHTFLAGVGSKINDEIFFILEGASYG